MAAALRGLRRYQEAERPPHPAAPPIAARAGRAALYDYGTCSSADAPSVVFVPSLINPAQVLDLAEGKSLLRWLATQGVRPLLVDWGTPSADDRDLSIAGHVERLLMPLLDTLPEPPLLAGYCLGGPMALAAATLRSVRGVALLAAPWRFSGFPAPSRQGLAMLWEQAQPLARQLGLLPVEVLQAGFWQLDPKALVAKYVRFGELDPADDAARDFVSLEDWANDGPPLTYAAGAELIEDFIGADVTGAGTWHVGGRVVDPSALNCPLLDVASRSDRIVPFASAAAIGDRLALAQGHVGMIIGRRAHEALWQPLARWFRDPRST